MPDQGKEVSKVQNPGRRAFVKNFAYGVAGLTGVAGLVNTLGANETQAKITSSSREITSVPDKVAEPLRGKVNGTDGSITAAIERISGQSPGNLPGLRLVWKNDGTDYVFTSQESFLNEVIVPLPMTQPGDEIIFGYEKDAEDKVFGPEVLTSKERVVLNSSNKMEGNIIEKKLEVIGGRFDRRVTFKLKDDSSGWEVNPEGERWVDSEEFKNLMNNNPEMKSSEAFEQL